MKATLFTLVLGLAALAGCGNANPPAVAHNSSATVWTAQNGETMAKVVKTDEDWKKTLTQEQYDILRQCGTEPPFNNAYWDNHAHGVYACAACGLELFTSDTKYDSGSGWPSFFQPIGKDRVNEKIDDSLGTRRIEVTCARCGGHLGHVFEDGPRPTGLRFCINSASMKFNPFKLELAQPTVGQEKKLDLTPKPK